MPLTFFQRDRTREHLITKFILSTINVESKPEDMDFADWIKDGLILTR